MGQESTPQSHDNAGDQPITVKAPGAVVVQTFSAAHNTSQLDNTLKIEDEAITRT